MKKFLLLPLFSLILFSMVHGQQKQPLTYYLPDISYEKDIPTPEEFLGFQIGEWHVSHDQQLAYMRKLAETSPRVTFQQIGNSYEGRPTINLIITSEKNHEKLDEIKADHVLLSDPTQSAEVDIKNLPTVLYQAYNIHGNEPSAGNSAILVAYYLAAGKGRDVERILDNVVTIIDPCLNPDGFNRFASWVNSHQNKNQTALGVDREYNEAWPGARTNHYWFDLNRDYMPVQHPESQGRINVFHDWKPNVYTDHHEMGTNSTFFFMPGEPSRVFPITPKKNQDLTEAIAQYHAATLDEIQSLYYAKEGFDDFYIGKGSTYPDVNGCIGILFEQASSRGHVQESANGLLTFPFTIRNQVRTSLSTQLACYELKDELNEFQREFYTTALEDARADKRKAFVFGDAFDKNKVGHFIEILRRHKIDVYKLDQQLEAGGKSFSPNHAYIIPTEQTQYRFIRSIFETQTTFEDSLFYDISTWTLPLAFNLPYSAVERNYSETLLGEKLEGLRPVVAFQEPDYSAYAYAFEWDDYYAPRAANYLMSQGLRLNVVNTPFVANGKNFNRGTVLVPLQNQPMSKDELFKVVLKASQDNKISIYDLDTGWTPEGPDLGSRGISLLRKPEVLLVVGEGTSPYDAGEVWHLLDQRYDIVTTKVEARDLDRIDPNRFNTIVMVDGSYSPVSQRAISGLQGWVAQGGNLIAYKRAISWCLRNGLGSATIKRPSDNRENQYLSSSGYASALQNNKEEEVDPRRPYAAASRDNGGKVIGGAIFNTTADLTHPLLYGYRVADLPIFRRGTLFLEPAKNPYATPVIYKNDPLLSGYINQENLGTIANTASIIVSGRGAGRILFMADNTNFRAFWFGTNKVLANAIFFGHTISSATIER